MIERLVKDTAHACLTATLCWLVRITTVLMEAVLVRR